MSVSVSFKMIWLRSVAKPRKTKRSNRRIVMLRPSDSSKSSWIMSSASANKTRKSRDWPKRKKMKREG